MLDLERHPWARGNLRVTRAALDIVERRAVAAYAADAEACGLLAGPASDVALLDESVPLENLADKLHAIDPESYPRPARTSFEVDARVFAREVDTRETNGRPAKVLWHSHLDVGAYFSDTDVAAMSMGGTGPAYDLAYLVLSVVKGSVVDRRLYIWNGSGFVASELRVEGEGG
jgi:proteasome lid subunit RPN8/RPN11